MQFGREIMGNSGDIDRVFEGFTGENLAKVDGDLDIDLDARLSDSSESEASDEEGDTLLTLSTESQSARLQDVQEFDFMEDLVQSINCQ